METAVTVGFADGRYRFWLPVTRAIELERKLEPLTIAEMEMRLQECSGIDQEGNYVFVSGHGLSVEAVREIIRVSLVGGNAGWTDDGEIEVGPQLAKQLVDDYVYPHRPLAEGLALCAHILFAAVRGIQLKKKDEDEEPKTPARKRSAKARSSPTAE